MKPIGLLHLVGCWILLAVGWFMGSAVAASSTDEPPTSMAATLAEPARHALVIGNSRYVTVSALPNVANDMADMCAALRRLRFQVTCLADLPTRNDFIAAVTAFIASVPPGTHAMFYYAGHAVQVSGENYLIPTGVNGNASHGWMSQFVRLSEIFQIAERTRAGFQFMVLDACRDNPDAAEAPPGAIATGMNQLRSMMSAIRGGGRFSATYGMASVRDAPSNTLVLFATGAGTSAFDGQGERNGPLTKHLLVQMQRARLSIDQVVKNVIQLVGDDTERRFKQRQSPSLYGTFTGEFCFDRCPPSQQQLEEERRRAQDTLRRRTERERRESTVVPAL